MSHKFKLFSLILIICQVVFASQIRIRVKRDYKGNSILDTGKGKIGIFLNKSVKNLQPLRKHYYWKIHHHNHNREDVLRDVHVLPRDITLCGEGAATFCPLGTTALCTKNSAIRCLTSLWSTEICNNGIFHHCANITLPCDKYAPQCRTVNKKYFNVMLHCISMVNVYANLVDINGTMAVEDLVKVYPPHFFCETVLAMPAKLTKGEEVFSKTSDIFGEFAVKALGISRR